MPLQEYLVVVFLSLLPVSELRGGIIYGLAHGLEPVSLFVVAVTVNEIAGLLVLSALNNLLPFFLKIALLEKFYNYSVLRARKQYEPQIKKYGSIGLVLFIAVPLPGTGSWTGALAAFLLGMHYKKFAIVNLIGVVIAGMIVTLAGLGAIELFF